MKVLKFLQNFVLLLCISNYSCSQNQKTKDMKTRSPAVAGQFYSAGKSELSRDVESLFSRGVDKKVKNTRAIITPHAGYVFSGEVAASAFNQIDLDRQYDNVFVITSSHRYRFNGASVYIDGNYRTPMGVVEVNYELGKELIEKHSNIFSGDANPHLDEHSLEVQLPFLQHLLKENLQIVPVIIGSQNTEEIKQIANALSPYFTQNNLFVISTDFSHYPNYEKANEVDSLTGKAILSNSPARLLKQLEENQKKNISDLSTSLCGWTSVLTLMYITANNDNYKYHKIQYKNSGDAGAGDKSRVVGYMAIAVTTKNCEIENPKSQKTGFILTEDDEKHLLNIVRQTVEEYTRTKKIPDIDPSGFGDALLKPCGAFVSIYKDGKLRGCIGNFTPSGPLWEITRDMALASATQDTRFKPASRDELPMLKYEISVLTPLRKIESIEEFELGKHGIYMTQGNRSGTFLPHVAEKTNWTAEEFLGHCARDKADIGWDGWKDPSTELYVYESIIIEE